MDNHSIAQRRKNMQAIRSQDTSIEIMLRKELWKRGLRYRVNYKNVFGKPDIIFLKNKIAIFCDSEFWHGYNWELKKGNISTNRDYWINKIEHNITRDKEVNEILKNEGYIVIRFWGNKIREDTVGCADYIEKKLKNK